MLFLAFIQQNIFGQNLRDYNLNIQINSRGYGVSFTSIEQTSKKNASVWELGFSSLKDPKEIRITNLSIANAGVYRYGKVNHIINLKAAYGKEITLSKRYDRNTVGIIWTNTGGLNIALQSPVMIDYINQDLNLTTVRYNPEIHERNNIMQSRGFFSGLSQTAIIPGIYFKQGINFEFGNFNYAPNRFESGVLLDMLFIRPELMYKKNHSPIFLSFYFSFAILNFEK